MRTVFRYLLLLNFIGISTSCKHNINNKEVSNPICYIYTNHDDDNRPLDSIKTYCNKSLENALELYTDTDSLDKTVSMLGHMAIFRLESEKFAVITDTTQTTFYKFEKGRYNKLFSDNYQMAFTINNLVIKDFNKDGFKDVLYTIPSGGSHGSDSMLIFFNPETKSLIYSNEPELSNVELATDTITSNTRFQRLTYIIKRYRLIVTQEKNYLQGKDFGKIEIKQYSPEGKILKSEIVFSDN